MGRGEANKNSAILKPVKGKGENFRRLEKKGEWEVRHIGGRKWG